MCSFPFPDREKSREELSRDLLHHKIPECVTAEIADKAWNIGVCAAEDILKKYETQTINEITCAEGLGIKKIPIDNVAANTRYFSEYYSGRNMIYLYEKSVGLWAENNHLSMEEAEEIILSHEFFHYLECKKIGLTSKIYQVPVLCLGKWVLIKSGIRALSEIGAHGFSRTYYEQRNRLEI